MIQRVEQCFFHRDSDSQAVHFVGQPDAAQRVLQIFHQRMHQRQVVVQHKRRVVASHAVHQPRLQAILVGAVDDLLHDFHQVLLQAAFGDVTGGTFFESLHGDLFASQSGHQDHRRQRIFGAHGFDQFQSVHFVHLQVGQHQIDRLQLQGLHGVLAIGGHQDFEAPFFFENAGCQTTVDGGIIHNQNSVLSRTHGAELCRAAKPQPDDGRFLIFD